MGKFCPHYSEMSAKAAKAEASSSAPASRTVNHPAEMNNTRSKSKLRPSSARCRHLALMLGSEEGRATQGQQHKAQAENTNISES